MANVFVRGSRLIHHVCGSIITTMPDELTTTKMTKAALQAARLIAARTGERQYAAVERILWAEADRLGLRHLRTVAPEAIPQRTQTQEERFEAKLKVLQQYAEREGHANVPSNHVEDGVQLGLWVSQQRSNRGSLPANRVEALEAIPGWRWRANVRPPGVGIKAHEEPIPTPPPQTRPSKQQKRVQATFEARLAVLRQYVEREGHADVPAKHMEGNYRLGAWVVRQRMDRWVMPEDQAQALESLPGWVWRKHVGRPVRGWQTVEEADAQGSK
jgi:hypothetical protein